MNMHISIVKTLINRPFLAPAPVRAAGPAGTLSRRDLQKIVADILG
ncbi:MAG: hypothetical protein U5M50_07510 [Sphingobium sp.]|nr:hypothetical protein [Sphingobium sp.]